MHQFDKVEMFSFVAPEDSRAEHERILAIEEEILGELGLPYRVVNIAVSDLGNSAAKKYDCEAWLPSQGRYRELTSCSNTTDYQARRLNIRMRARASGTRVPHTLNGTAVAVGRTIVALLENGQREDGSVELPACLVRVRRARRDYAPSDVRSAIQVRAARAVSSGANRGARGAAAQGGHRMQACRKMERSCAATAGARSRSAGGRVVRSGAPASRASRGRTTSCGNHRPHDRNRTVEGAEPPAKFKTPGQEREGDRASAARRPSSSSTPSSTARAGDAGTLQMHDRQGERAGGATSTRSARKGHRKKVDYGVQGG